MRFWALTLALVGCAPLPAGGGGGEAAEADARIASLVTTERRTSGAALVFIDEGGRRVSDLTTTSGKGIVDRQPAFAPSGRWVAFASNRGRKGPSDSNIWVARAEAGGKLFPVSKGAWVDRDPVWSPSGDAILFSSNRKGSFDIYRQLVRANGGALVARGRPKRLTRTPGQALAPAISPNGRWIVFMEVQKDGTSGLARVSADGGNAEQLTRGPTDVTPTFAPDGKTIYFAARASGRSDADIYVVGLRGTGKQVFISEPDADQSGPRFSKDGKVLFATAVYRSQSSGKPVLASVVAAVLDGKPKWRALHDPAFVESRVGVAVAPRKLQMATLARNPEYGAGLRRALERAIRDVAAEDAAREKSRK